MTLDTIIRKAHRLRRDAGIAIVGVGLIVSLSCSEKKRHPTLIEEFPVWDTLSSQSVPEDSNDGTLIYANLKDKAQYNETIRFGVIPNATFLAYFDGKDLKIKNMKKDWSGTDTVSVTANEAVGSFILNVIPVDDPAYWNVLQDKQVVKNASDGTLVYANILSMLVDPDSPKEIAIISQNAHFQAYYLEPDIRIRSLMQGWTGSDSIKVSGNGKIAGFLLHVTDAMTTWNTVPDVSCDEDGSIGTVLLSDLSNYVNNAANDFNFTTAYDLGEARLRINSDKLLVDYLQANWNGTKTFQILCNSIPSNQITLRINPVDDPARWISAIPPCRVPHNPPNHTTVLSHLDDYARDIDSPLVFAVTSQQPYTLQVEGASLFISNVPQDYQGTDTITMTCNSIPVQFDITVLPIFMQEIYSGDVMGSELAANENIYIVNFNSDYRVYNTHTFQEIGNGTFSSSNPIIIDDRMNMFSGSYHDICIYDRGNFSKQQCTSISPDYIEWMAKNTDHIYALTASNTIRILNARTLQEEDTWTVPVHLNDRPKIIANDAEITIATTEGEYTGRIDAYSTANFSPIFSDTLMRNYFATDIDIEATDNYMLVRTGPRMKLYDRNTNQVIWSRTLPYEIYYSAISDSKLYIYCEEDYSTKINRIYDLLTLVPRHDFTYRVYNDKGVQFSGDRFYLIQWGIPQDILHVYQLNE